MRGSGCVVGAAAALATVILASPAAAIPLTVDNFEDDTTMGWFVPGPSLVPPINVASGGPAGAGDNYLQLDALGGGGAGSRLSVQNGTQWTGDFLAAGLSSIEMDVNNFGPNPVTLRLLFEDFAGPGPPVNLATTLANIVVPVGSGWVHVVFDLSPANLTALIGTAGGALSSVDTMRIFHNTIADFPGPGQGIPAIDVTVGVDNIAANAVPEPVTGALLMGGLAAALRRRRAGRR